MLMNDHIAFKHFKDEEIYILSPYFEYFYEMQFERKKSHLFNLLKEITDEQQIEVCKEILANGYEKVMKGSFGDKETILQKMTVYSQYLINLCNQIPKSEKEKSLERLASLRGLL